MNSFRLFSYAGIVGVTCLLFLFWMLPMEIAGRYLVHRHPALSYIQASGTLWNGQLRSVRLGAYLVGTADITVRPLSFLTGRLAGNIVITGSGLNARGRYAVGPAGRFRLQDMTANVNLGAYVIQDTFDQPMVGRFEIGITTLEYHKSRCHSANIMLQTDALHQSLRQYDIAGFDLAGAARCDAGQLHFSLAGEGQSEKLHITSVVHSNLDYTAEARVQTADVYLARALEVFGFVAEEDEFVYIQRGNFLYHP